MLLPPFIQDHLQWFVCGAIAVVGIVIYGFQDLIRLSAGRVWAISSVCFAESVRRKVWLITPLAILGVIIVSQLQRPLDERDAIRQTIKFCLFATGLLVTITAIILACTNLPREIESRVIYTVVTKPTTRLEIVLGKIVGFARVSALILVIMGLFTFGYLHWRAWRFESGIRDRLAEAGRVDEVSRPTLEYYRDAGLLTAREMAFTEDMQVYSRPPQPGSPRRFMAGTGEGDMIVPFEVKPVDLIPAGVPPEQNVGPGAAGLYVSLRMGAQRLPGYVEESTSTLSPFVAAPNTTQPTTGPSKPAQILVQVLDQYQNNLVPAKDINGGQPTALASNEGNEPTPILIPPAAAQTIYKPGTNLDKPMRFYLQITGLSPGHEYFVESTKAQPDPIVIVVPAAQGSEARIIKPAPDARLAGHPTQPMLRGREGTSGQQIRGGPADHSPLAVYRFDNVSHSDAGDATFEFRSGIERSAAEEEGDETYTRISATAFNRDTNEESPPVAVALESNHQSYFRLPSQFLKGGNFDIRVRCNTPGHYVGLFPKSLALVRSTQGFDINLVKSLLIMWLMAILVITVAIFTSTFLSWPTAIVLTLVILLGRWGVEQLGDATQPGIGNLVATDMGFTDPNKAKVVSSVAEALAGGLNALAKVLPDISQFAATEDIERGMVVPMHKLTNAGGVLLCYGLALLAMAYVRLTWVEVAP